MLSYDTDSKPREIKIITAHGITTLADELDYFVEGGQTFHQWEEVEAIIKLLEYIPMLM